GVPQPQAGQLADRLDDQDLAAAGVEDSDRVGDPEAALAQGPGEARKLAHPWAPRRRRPPIRQSSPSPRARGPSPPREGVLAHAQPPSSPRVPRPSSPKGSPPSVPPPSSSPMPEPSGVHQPCTQTA